MVVAYATPVENPSLRGVSRILLVPCVQVHIAAISCPSTMGVFWCMLFDADGGRAPVRLARGDDHPMTMATPGSPQTRSLSKAPDHHAAATPLPGMAWYNGGGMSKDAGVPRGSWP